MNVNMLKGAIRGRGLTQGEVADRIGMSLSHFNAKLNQRAGAEFSLRELQALKVILELTLEQMGEIFFR